jgi:HlyD family secretion protein
VVGIRVGNEATIDIDAIPDKQFKGHVVAIGKNAQIKNPGTDAEVTTFFVRVGLDDPPEGGLPGMSAAVSISTATHTKVLTVPIQAVTSREAPRKKDEEKDKEKGETQVARAGGPDAGAEEAAPASGKPKPLKVVFVVGKSGNAEMRVVHTGIASRSDVEILDGLSEGETIVDGPYRTLARELKDGQSVKEMPKGGPGENGKGQQGQI